MRDQPVVRLAALREQFASIGLDAFIAQRADPHIGEHIPPEAERLAWLTGFTGSAGLVAVTHKIAAIFVDGRYQIQARQECPPEWFDIRNIKREPLSAWLIGSLAEESRIGYDPRLFSVAEIEGIEKKIAPSKLVLTPVPENPVDLLRTPALPARIAATSHFGAIPWPVTYAGRDSAEKRREIALILAKREIDVFLLTQPESIAWLFNLRGQDVPCTPVLLCWALLHRDGSAQIFLDPSRWETWLPDYLGTRVRLAPETELPEALRSLARNGTRIGFAPRETNAWLHGMIRDAGGTLLAMDDPSALARAHKHPVEIEGMRRAHRIDAVAMCRFLAWFNRNNGESRTESMIADRLEDFRRQSPDYRGPSFPTIAGTGPNSAIVHYRAIQGQDATLQQGELLLIDSGGQYRFGTTDITRTIANTKPGTTPPVGYTEFNLVLKGHIAIARLRFPQGVKGSQIDALARQALWSHGLNFDHGTGHGVGCYLGVHEGPQRIAASGSDDPPLAPGMVLSNEPGYYRAHAFGIRIENLILVRSSGNMRDEKHPLFEFETLTLVPIDRNLIAPSMLDPAEIAWIDTYHARIQDEISPLLEPDEAAWLADACAPLVVPPA